MLNKLKPKSEFSRNVLTLMTGTTMAQAIPIAISPILTRIYTPEDFGVFAFYMAIATIVAVIATGRYELAIMLPKKDNDAINIVVLSILISFFISLILFLIILIFNAEITSLLNSPKISNWLYFIPFTVYITGIYQSFNYWSNRKKQYKRLAISRVVQSGVTSSNNISMGFVGLGSSGLILGQLLGQGIATTILGKLIWNEDKNRLKQIKKIKIIALAKKYIKFPKFLILAHGMNIASGQAPVILLASLFSTGISGYYMLIQRVIGLPMSVIASSISDVFRQQASYDYTRIGNCKKVYLSTLKKLFFLALFPFITFYFVAPELFAFVFSEKWRIAGEYAQILTPMFFFQFISSPLGNMALVAQKQELDLYWQIFLFVLISLSFYIGGYILEDITLTLMLFSLSYSIAYLTSLVMTYNFSKGDI